MDWCERAACRGIDPELFFPVGTAGPAPAKTSSMLLGADAWVRPMLCAMAAGGALVRQGIVVAW